MSGTEQVGALVARYTPEIAAQLRSARAQRRNLIPNGNELVYDNYNALVFAFGPTPRPSEPVISIAAYPRWITLFFAKRRGLDDPESLLLGTGTNIRSVRLSASATLKSAAVRALVVQALVQQAASFKAAPPLVSLLERRSRSRYRSHSSSCSS